MVQQTDSKFSEHQNEKADMVSKSDESFLLKDSGPCDESNKVSGIKRPQQSPGSNKGNLVYVRRKTDSEHHKNKTCNKPNDQPRNLNEHDEKSHEKEDPMKDSTTCIPEPPLVTCDGIDRISDLPDDILHLILSALPTTEEVVRSSILSTRWRYLWTSFSYSSLELGFSRIQKAPSKFEMKKFKEFMSRVLVNKSLDLDIFCLFCSNHYNMRTVEQWIDSAIRRNVKLIHLLVWPEMEFKVPHCLVNNGSLKVLRLFLFGKTLSLPNSTGLGALRVLELNTLKLVDNDLPLGFLKSCPLLEDLSLIDCWLKEEGPFCISCPKLKKLRINNRELDQGMSCYVLICCPKLVFWEVAGYIYHNFIIKNLDSLEKAVFHPQLFRLGKEEVVAEISHPENLCLAIFFHHKLPEQQQPEVDVPPKTLEVTTTIDFLTKHALTSLLVDFPNLKSLHLIIIQGPFWPTLYSNLGEDRMRILTEHLKRVEFVDFNGEKENLFVARCLLEHGKVLEEMVFSWGNEATHHDRSLETMKEVSNFHKASSTVKLISLLKN